MTDIPMADIPVLDGSLAIFPVELAVEDKQPGSRAGRFELELYLFDQVLFLKLFGSEPFSEAESSDVVDSDTFLADDPPVLSDSFFTLEDAIDGLFYAGKADTDTGDLGKIWRAACFHKKIEDLLHVTLLIPGLLTGPGGEPIESLTTKPGSSSRILIVGEHLVPDLLAEHLFDGIRDELGLLGRRRWLRWKVGGCFPFSRSFGGRCLDALRRFILDADLTVSRLLLQETQEPAYSTHDTYLSLTWSQEIGMNLLNDPYDTISHYMPDAKELLCQRK